MKALSTSKSSGNDTQEDEETEGAEPDYSVNEDSNKSAQQASGGGFFRGGKVDAKTQAALWNQFTLLGTFHIPSAEHFSKLDPNLKQINFAAVQSKISFDGRFAAIVWDRSVIVLYDLTTLKDRFANRASLGSKYFDYSSISSCVLSLF